MVTRQKRWGEFEHEELLDAGAGELLDAGAGELLDAGAGEQLDAGAGEQLDDGEELEEIRKLLRELSNRVKAVPLRNMIVEEERE